MSHAIIPLPDAGVNIRAATLEDVPFIDRLQKMHSKMVGFMPNGQLVGKISAGDVLVAEAIVGRGGLMVEGEASSQRSTLDDQRSRTRVGYVIGTDRYFKRDDVGIIYHLNVMPGKQRAFVGAALLKAQFERSAYGCRLYCCWCAQDIEANRFWEAMGFVPLAYRAGSEKKARVHIFWQKRIRSGDDSTPWWFPSQTTGGAIREDRLVLPIPPGKHWSEVMPVLLPQEKKLLVGSCELAVEEKKKTRRQRSSLATGNSQLPTSRVLSTSATGMRFAPVTPLPPPAEPVKGEKPVREKKPKRKNDPKLIAAARELRDRWLERVNAGQYVFEDGGKYEVTKVLSGVGGGTDTTRQWHLSATAGCLPSLPPAA